MNEDTFYAMAQATELADARAWVEDLEELVRWFVVPFTHEDPETGEIVVNEPVWSYVDRYGHDLEGSKRLAATFGRVAFFLGQPSEETEEPGDNPPALHIEG